MPLTLSPIGIIRSPFTTLEGMPIQPAGARDVRGELHLEPKFVPALSDLDGFSHAILIYHFHKSSGHSLTVRPFLDTVERGLFATRAPRRPNPLGLSIVRIAGVNGEVVEVLDVDILDGTPLLDIKPYVPRFDAVPDARCGWLQKDPDKVEDMRSDDRFSGQEE